MTERKSNLAAAAIRTAAVLGLALSLGVANAQAGTRRCPSFSVPRTYTATSEVTFVFSRVRASGVSCRKTRELITLYLYGKGRPAGTYPTDGTIVDGWNVVVIADAASGKKGHAYFSAVYT